MTELERDARLADLRERYVAYLRKLADSVERGQVRVLGYGWDTRMPPEVEGAGRTDIYLDYDNEAGGWPERADWQQRKAEGK